MAELIAVLIVLGILLAVVTVVGHGIWVLLALLFRGVRSQGDADATAGPAVKGNWSCPRCRTALEPQEHACAVCGWPGQLAPRSRLTALQKLRQQLEGLAQLGLVDRDAGDKLVAAVRAEEARIASAEVQAGQAAAAPMPTETAPDKHLPVPPSTAAAAPFEPPAATQAASEATSPAFQAEPASAAERARKYMVSREAAATEARAEAAAPTPEPPPRREALSRLLAAFMEEKNIRWGELVGGLLIVGCSIALVISFWAQIADRPLLKFVLLNGVTAALFGVGLYTDRRWKIHTTSHGILIIAALLVPLNFLAIAAFTQHAAPTDILSLAGEVASLAVFASLVFLAGRVLVPGDPVLLASGVMVPALLQLIVRRFAGPATELVWLYLMAAVPIVVYSAGTVLAVRRRWMVAAGPLSEPEAVRVLTFFGLVSFAAVWPLALLAHKVPPFQDTLHRLSPLAAACGLPALLVGLLFWQKIVDRSERGLQTAGVAVGVLGGLIMCGAVALAWPDPATMLPTALVAAVVLTWIAVSFGIPAAHLPAGLALAAAWLIAVHLLRGNIAWMLPNDGPIRSALLSATSGHALVPFVLLYGILATWLHRWSRPGEAKMTAFVAAAVATISLALVMWFGFARAGDSENATWTLAIYALVTLGAAIVLDHGLLARVAAALLFVTLVEGIVYRYGPTWQFERPLLAALLTFATVAVALCGVVRWPPLRSKVNVQMVLAWSALVVSVAAAGLLLATAPATSATTLAIHLAWLGSVWLLFGAIVQWRTLLIAARLAVVAAILCAVTAVVETRPWYAAAAHPWLDPWFLQAQGVAIGVYCLLMFALRHRWATLDSMHLAGKTWSASQWADNWTLERLLETALPVLLAVMAVYAILPGAAQELEPLEMGRGTGVAVRVVTPVERFEMMGIDHVRAGDRGAWALLVVVAAVLILGWWQRGTKLVRWGVVVVAAAACALLAARWEVDVAVASALRWLTAGLFLVLFVFLRFPIFGGGVSDTAIDPEHSGKPPATEATWPAASTEMRDWSVALVVLVYVVMGAYVFQAALWRASVPWEISRLWPWLLVWALVAGIAALLMPRAAQAKPPASQLTQHGRHLLLTFGAAPVLILVTFAVARALDQHPIVGPEPASWFRRIGWDVSYGVPLAVIALGCVGYAIRDRSSRFAFAAGLLLNAVATIVVLMRLARGGGSLDASAWIVVAQVNAIVAGGVALAWLAAAKTRPPLLRTQVALAAVLCAMFLTPAAVDLGVRPYLSAWVGTAGSAPGWGAVLLATAAAAWLARPRGATLQGIALSFAALVILTAATSTRWDTGNWLAFHVLLAGCCVAAWLVPLAASAFGRDPHDTVNDEQSVWSAPAVRLFAVAAVALVLREMFAAPFGPWWIVGALLAISARNLWIAWHDRRRGFMWIAAVLWTLAVAEWWLHVGAVWTGTPGGAGLELDATNVVVIALAMMALVSVWVERRRIVPLLGPPARRRGLAYHRFGAWLVVAVLTCVTAMGLVEDLVGNSPTSSGLIAWAAWAAAVASALACLWDPAIRWPVACSYCVGLIGVGIFLDRLNLQPPLFQWALALALAAYSLATSTLWSGRQGLRATAARWGITVSAAASSGVSGGATSEFRRNSATWEGSGHGWLVPMNFLLGVAVLALVFWIVTTMASFTERMVAAYAVGAQAFALGLLARGAVRTSLQYAALAWGVFFAIAFAWAWLPPAFPAPWLHRLVLLIAALAGTVVVYGFGLVKLLRRENEWTRAAGRIVPLLTGLALAFLLLVLAIEVRSYLRSGVVPVEMWATLAVGVALAVLAIAALLAALVPGRDPLGLSERGRTVYVYAAEALAGLLFLHIRVTMPWLFSGWFLRFWPLVVMAIAFVGVGLGELFERRRQRVLSEPLRHTGALLPLLPALGFWAAQSDVHYSLLLLSIGVLYGALSTLRKSFWYGVLAAIAANGSLWFLFYRSDTLGLLEHPQLWLIPPALSVLAAGYLNRERLSAKQLAALRYFAAIVIYVSSTADVFINGVAEAPWLPGVLAGLSIVGVLAGIVLQVRAFLYLGTAFLVVALLTIIWHAAEQRIWIWWVAGIVTGVAIVALFGLFEKRREDVLGVVEKMKHWEA